VRQLQLLARLRARGHAGEARRLEAVVLDGDLLGLDAQSDEVVAHAAGDRDHARGALAGRQRPAPAQAAAGHAVQLEEDLLALLVHQRQRALDLAREHGRAGVAAEHAQRGALREARLLQPRGHVLQRARHAVDPVDAAQRLRAGARARRHAVVLPQVDARRQLRRARAQRVEQRRADARAREGAGGLRHLQRLRARRGHARVGDDHERLHLGLKSSPV
jgi:hypothetical protein